MIWSILFGQHDVKFIFERTHDSCVIKNQQQNVVSLICNWHKRFWIVKNDRLINRIEFIHIIYIHYIYFIYFQKFGSLNQQNRNPYDLFCDCLNIVSKCYHHFIRKRMCHLKNVHLRLQKCCSCIKDYSSNYDEIFCIRNFYGRHT